jgi:exopolysaccharide biosynthesis polyprenyl glycosylphosphotransferase
MLADALAQRLSIKNFLLLTSFLIVWTGIHQLTGVYTDFRPLKTTTSVLRILFASALGSAFFIVFPLLSNGRVGSIFFPVLIFFSIASLESVLVRWILSSLLVRLRRMDSRASRTIVIGSGSLAASFLDSLSESQTTRRTVLGFVDQPGLHTIRGAISDSLLGAPGELESILMRTAVDEVIIALPLRSCYDQVQLAIRTCQRLGVPISYHLQPFDHSLGMQQVQAHLRQPYVSWHPSRMVEMNAVKRMFDFSVALVVLAVSAPLFLFLAIAVKLSSRGPFFFVQERYGLNKAKFRMYKFRTMVADAEALQKTLESHNEAQGPVFKIKNDPRITPLGRLLRKTSLDELPQLLNVLRGDMSLVGPRPLPNRDVSRFHDAAFMRRFSVKPGLTCLWQVHGRSDTNFDRWIAYDLEYIDTWSPMLDLKILMMTIPAVMRGSGAM